MSLTIPGTLEGGLSSLDKPARLPAPLPLTHLTVVPNFTPIVTAGRIDPKLCDVFQTNLVYLFYGSIFYRTSLETTENASEQPVVFIFRPPALRHVDHYYPFDTGALIKTYPEEWRKKLGSKAADYKINSNGDTDLPSRLVFHLYKDNKNYLDGKVDPAAQKNPPPFPVLFNFLSADLSGAGVDDRQRAIEALSVEAIPFDDLAFVAYPESRGDEFRTLFETLHPKVKPPPIFYPYPCAKNFRPNEVAVGIRHVAYLSLNKEYER
jgi:hypothetical protein